MPIFPPSPASGPAQRPFPAVVRPALLDAVREERSASSTEGAGFGSSFKDVLAKALAAVDAAQKEADAMGMKLAAGENVELHDVTMAQERAMLHLELTLAFQRKIVEAYQEISRMQV